MGCERELAWSDHGNSGFRGRVADPAAAPGVEAGCSSRAFGPAHGFGHQGFGEEREMRSKSAPV